MRYELDGGFGAGGGRLGLIVLATDLSLENELRQVLAGRPVSLLHARIPADPHVTPEGLRLMEAAMSATAALLPPGLDAIGYACTSGATVIGPDRVAELIRAVHPQAQVSTPITAAVTALRALAARRIGFASPYVASVTVPIRAYLAGEGIDTLHEASFGQSEDATVARIAEASTRAMLCDLAGRGGIDALFASCTNLRSFGILDTVERQTGLPVVSSNQALIWHMLRLAGIDARGWGPGRLFGIA